MRYRELFSIRIENPYYPGMKSTDFTLEPSVDCERALRNYRLFVKPDPAGLQVVMPVDEDGNHPLLPFKEKVRFDFWLRLRNPDVPLFTDFAATFDGQPIENPVFTNEDAEELPETGRLGKRLRLKAKELEINHTDEFQTPASLPDGEKETPFILKQNPRPAVGELLIYIPRGGTTPAAGIKDAWNDYVQASGNPADQRIKGFQLQPWGNEMTPIRGTGYESLAKPLEVILQSADGENGLRITYSWYKKSPKIILKKNHSVVLDQGHEAPKFGVAFEMLPGENALGLTFPDNFIRSQSSEGARGPVTCEMVVKRWLDWTNLVNDRGNRLNHSMGFRLEVMGDGSSEISDLVVGAQTITHLLEEETNGKAPTLDLPLTRSDTSELIWPPSGAGGIKVTYTGDLPRSRIRIVEWEDDTENIIFEAKDDLDIFSITHNATVAINRFDRPANVIWINPEGEWEAPFHLHYPLRPQLPWGVFGKVEIHTDQNFHIPEPDGSSGNQFALHFFNNRFHWKFLLLVEDKEHDYSIVDKRFDLEETEKANEVEDNAEESGTSIMRFHSYDLNNKSREKENVFLTNKPGDVKESDQAYSKLWHDAWDIIEKEQARGNLSPGTRYFLFISKDEKIGNRSVGLQNIQLVKIKRSTLQDSSPDQQDQSDQQNDKESESTSAPKPETVLDHLPFPDLLRDWLYVIDLRIPEYIKSFKV